MFTHLRHHRCLIAPLFVAAFAVSFGVQADQARVGFTLMFGDDVRAVERTRETDDDARLAERIFGEAESAQHPPELMTYLYEKAFEYGKRDVSGYRVAGQALDRIVERDASRRLEVGEKRLVFFEAWHNNERRQAREAKEAGVEHNPGQDALDPDEMIDLCLDLGQLATAEGEFDRAVGYLRRGSSFASRVRSPRKNELKDAITEVYKARKRFNDVAELEAALAEDPSAADRLAMIYLTEFDDPAKAATYADRMTDAEFAAQVRLAAVEFDAATPADANNNGLFYFGLASEGGVQPVPMLIRAKVWLTEYLSREQGEADAIKAAHGMLGQIDQSLIRHGVGQKLARIMAGKVRGKGQFERPEDIQAAIDKGVKWLYEQRDPERHWEQDAETHRNWGGYTSLVVYALLMADEDPRTNRDLNRSANFMMSTTMKGTYALCFRIHAWEVLPQRERFRRNLQRDVLQLRTGMTRHGFWGYTMKGNDVVPGKKLDLSTTLAGGLGIWIGEEVAGLTPRPADWERIVRAMIKYQRDDSGWAYNPAVAEASHGSMTAAALALLHAGYPHVNDNTKEKADLAIAKGMKWMDENFSPTTNVNRGNFKNYYFAAVQHAGIFSGRRDFRGMDWYESIAKHLVQSQFGDGSWGSVQETAFAVAFLCRGGIVYEPSIGDLPEPGVEGSGPAEEAGP